MDTRWQPEVSPRPFLLFSNKTPRKPKSQNPNPKKTTTTTDHGDSYPTSALSFAKLGLPQWSIATCAALGIRRPTAVQRRPRHPPPHRRPAPLRPPHPHRKGRPRHRRHRLRQDRRLRAPHPPPLGGGPLRVFALVVTPSRELAVQLIEQFRAFGVGLNVRCCLVVGGMGVAAQAKGLVERPHVVAPGRIRALMEDNPDIAAAFSKTKFLVLDEADRVLDVGF